MSKQTLQYLCHANGLVPAIVHARTVATAREAYRVWARHEGHVDVTPLRAIEHIDSTGRGVHVA